MNIIELAQMINAAGKGNGYGHELGYNLDVEPWDEYIAQLSTNKGPKPVANFHWFKHGNTVFLSFRYGDKNPGIYTWYRDEGTDKGPVTAIPLIVVVDIKDERVIETRHVSDDPSGRVLDCGGNKYVVFYDSHYGSAYIYHPNGKYIGDVSMETRKEFPENAVKATNPLEEGEVVLKKQKSRRGINRFLVETESSADYLRKTPQFRWEPRYLV